MAQQVSINTFGVAKWVVSSDATQGTHTTIGGALTSASSGDTIFIRTGTYTENLTLKAGVNLVALDADALTPNVIILGKATFTAAGTVSISGIQLKTNSDFFLAVTGSAASIVNLINCNLNCNNNTGISFTTSSSSAQINVNYCVGNLATTGIAYFSSSSAGVITFNTCQLSNTGLSTTNCTISAGSVSFINTYSSNAVTTSSSGVFNSTSSSFFSVNNNTALTLGGTNTGTATFSQFTGGSASAASVGTGCTLNGIQCDFNSTNTNAVTGAGTTAFGGCTFTNTSKINNATTQSGGCATGVQVSPSSGYIGENLRANAAVNPTNGNPITVTSVALTPGVWDVSGMCDFGGTITGTNFRISISNTNNVLGGSTGVNQISWPTPPTAASNCGGSILPQRVVLTANATYYLVVQAAFTVGTLTASGSISATRVG